MKSLLSQIVSAGLGLWLATIFVAGVSITAYPATNFFGIHLTAQWELFILFGIILGLLNFFVKPILNIITLPLRILTLGIFSFVINVGLIFALDIMFKEFSAPLLYPLFFTTLIVWGLNLLLSTFVLRNRN